VAVRLAIAGALLIVAIVVALALERRRRATLRPFRSASELQHVQRADFPRPDAPWLALLFTSTDCDGCGPMAQRVAPLESEQLAVAVCEYHDQRELHARYQIDSVPYLVVVDHDGVVRASFLGTAGRDEIWTKVHALTATD
jgi:hypothetical protein